MNRVPIRRRVFWALIALGTVPLGVAILVAAQRQRASTSPAGPRAALEEVTASSRALLEAADTSALTEPLRRAIDTHLEVVTRRTAMARRADTLTRTAAGALALGILIIGVGALAGSIWLARRWSILITDPVDELIDWVDRIGRGIALPPTNRSDAPEYDGLRDALRSVGARLQIARDQAVERERLIAFQETARRVAHEIRGPLTSIRLALSQLTDQQTDASRVLQDETSRLDRMAREFSEFGRLPSGPVAPVDLIELIHETSDATLPPELSCDIRTTETTLTVTGRYESLRRALQNVLFNAARATDQRGVVIEAERQPGRAVVRVMDYGPGIPATQRIRVFDPYVTGEEGGTGLGLAIARRAIEDHDGKVVVDEAPTGGAAFTITLPLPS